MSDPRATDPPRQYRPNARGLSRRHFLAAGAGAAGLLAAGSIGVTWAAGDGRPGSDTLYEPVPVAETPPLPGEPCADPPGIRGRATHSQ